MGLPCVHAVVAIDVNSREVERWGSQGMGGWMCCGGHRSECR